jgi:hypothetical protein
MVMANINPGHLMTMTLAERGWSGWMGRPSMEKNRF